MVDGRDGLAFQSAGAGAVADPDREEAIRVATRHALRRLVPLLLAMYVIAFLDRSNVGFAQDRLEADRGISDAAYAAGAGIFFVGYAVLEVPSNIILHRVGARRWMTRIMISWGIVAMAMALVTGPTSFYVLRFALGVAEAGFFPGVILYLTYWAPLRYRAGAMGAFYLGLPIAQALGGPLSGLLLDADGVAGLHGWQWMFGVEGLLAVVMGFVALRYLTDRPKDADWLGDTDRTVLIAALEREDAAKVEAPREVLAALKSWRVLYFALVYFCLQIAVYGLTFYLPTQVAAIAHRDVGWQVGLLSAIPWTAAVVVTIAVSRLSDRRPAWRQPVAVVLLLLAAVGIAASAAVSSPVLAMAALTLAACAFVSVQPVFWTFPTAVLAGFGAAAGIALINALGNLGGFVAPNARNWISSTTGSDDAGLYLLAAAPVVGALLLAVLRLRPGRRPAQ